MFNRVKVFGSVFIFTFLLSFAAINAQVPNVVSTLPENNEMNVSSFVDISVTFDVDIDETTINNSTFIVIASSTGQHQGLISYDSQTRTATFDPVDDFIHNEVVTVQLTTGIQSSAGIPLSTDYNWAFNIFICGDVNGDGFLDISDLVYFYVWLFGEPPGPPPVNMEAADMDECEGVDINDLIYYINWAFSFPPGPAPCESTGECSISNTGSITLDSVDGLYGSSSDTLIADGNTLITFYLRITGDADYHTGITNGFSISSPDGAEWGSFAPDTLPMGWSNLFDLIFAINTFSVTGSGADTVGFGGAALNGQGLPSGFDEVSYSITIGPIDTSYNGKTIVLDSSFYFPTGTWKWANPEAYPDWDGPHVFTIFGESYICGDVDGSGDINFADLVYLVHFLFLEGEPPPPIMEAADVDGFPGVNVSDIAYLVNWMFGIPIGPAPCEGSPKSNMPINEGIISLDHVDGLYNSLYVIKAGEPISFYIRINNDVPGRGTPIPALTNGFRIYSPTGTNWGTTIADTTDTFDSSPLDGGFFINNYGITGSGADTVGFGGYAQNDVGIPAGYNSNAYKITIGPIDPIYDGDTICLDSSWYPPVNEWLWATGYEQYFSDWNGPHCFEVARVSYLKANFNSNLTAGAAPLTVDFIDLSAGNPETWSWDFGDGGTSTSQNPSHQYNDPGMYDVTLSVTDSSGEVDSSLKQGYIKVGENEYSDLVTMVNINPWGNRPGFDLWYWCYWTNQGTGTAENCTLKVTLPYQMQFTELRDSSGAPIIDYSMSIDTIDTITGDTTITITLPIGTVEPSNDWNYIVPYGLLPATTASGDTLKLQMWLSSSTFDWNSFTNYAQHVLEVSSSKHGASSRDNTYGNKVAYPNGTNNLWTILPSSQLIFTIEFENSAQATSNIVELEIVDTLDPDLNAEDWSFNIGPMSHPDRCAFISYDYETREIKWWCDNIDLPPNINPPEGEAFFTYSIFPKPDLLDGTEIINTAQIEYGFSQWVAAGPLVRIIGECCIPPIRGNVDYDYSDEINIADLVYLVEYSFNPDTLVPWPPAPPCEDEGNIDGIGSIDIADIVYLVEYMFGDPFGPPPENCISSKGIK